MVSKSAAWMRISLLKMTLLVAASLDCPEVSQFPTSVPQLPQKHFCLWMNVKLLLLMEGYKQEMSYSDNWLTSLLRCATSKLNLQQHKNELLSSQRLGTKLLAIRTKKSEMSMRVMGTLSGPHVAPQAST